MTVVFGLIAAKKSICTVFAKAPKLPPFTEVGEGP